MDDAEEEAPAHRRPSTDRAGRETTEPERPGDEGDEGKDEKVERREAGGQEDAREDGRGALSPPRKEESAYPADRTTSRPSAAER